MFSVFPKRLALGQPKVWGIAAAIALASVVAGAPALAQPEARDSTTPTATPTVSGGRIVRPTLQLGSQGESVRELQSMLILLGYYPGPVTGVYAEDTAAATRRFQSAADITADGIVGPATWSRLFPTPPSEANPPTAMVSATDSDTAPGTSPATAANTPSASSTESAPGSTAGSTTALPVLRLGMEGDVVRQLQQRLRTKGFYSGAIDGIFGSQTEAAVRQAQTANDLTVDGIVGPATWRALN